MKKVSECVQEFDERSSNAFSGAICLGREPSASCQTPSGNSLPTVENVMRPVLHELGNSYIEPLFLKYHDILAKLAPNL